MTETDRLGLKIDFQKSSNGLTGDGSRPSHTAIRLASLAHGHGHSSCIIK